MTKIISSSLLSKELQTKIKLEVSGLKQSKKVISKTELPKGLYTQKAAVQFLYWNNMGKFEKELEQINKDFIPSFGPAPKIAAELVRCVQNIYYDCCNNGWGNNKLKDANTLLKHQDKFCKYFKKGATSCNNLLKNLRDAQFRVADKYKYMDDEEINKLFTSIEPHMDSLVDAVVEFAYNDLYNQ